MEGQKNARLQKMPALQKRFAPAQAERRARCDLPEMQKGVQSKNANINVVFDYIYKTVQCGEHCIILYKTHVNKTGGAVNTDILVDLYFLNVSSVELVDNEYKYTF